MTATDYTPTRWCRDCFCFNFVVCKELGVCTEIGSDHNRHVLDALHPACDWYRGRK